MKLAGKQTPKWFNITKEQTTKQENLKIFTSYSYPLPPKTVTSRASLSCLCVKK